MPIKEFIKDYLYFSKRDRIGVLAVFGLVMIIYFLPVFFPSNDTITIQKSSFLDTVVDTLTANTQSSDPSKSDGNFYTEPVKGIKNYELFYFDPNTLSSEGWNKLGLPKKSITTINRFRSKGGRFHKTEDLEKIWGLPKDFYNRVKKFIRLEDHKKEFNYPQSSVSDFKSKERIIKPVSINDADTSAFIALPGIGSKLASRIIAFREKLGGFFSVDQVAEIFGLKDSTFQKIKPLLVVSGTIKQFHLNTTTKDELKVHPYFRWTLANAIIEYRNLHGNFKSMEEIKNISIIDEVTYKKIVHYLEL